MVVWLAAAWRLAFAVGLCAAIFTSACVRAPRRSVPGGELRLLVGCALMLYLVGGLASLTHHTMLAGFVYGAGIVIAAVAVWLSRGRDQEDPPDGDEPADEQPPPEPDGVPPKLDWPAFERDFRAYAHRQRQPTSRS
jgi:hypothetical protein